MDSEYEALIAEVKRRLMTKRKNLSPLQTLLNQKSIDKIDNINSAGNDLQIKPITLTKFIKKTCKLTPFKSIKRLEIKNNNYIGGAIKKLANPPKSIFSANNESPSSSVKKSYYYTPFQKYHKKINFFKKLVDQKINKQFPIIELRNKKDSSVSRNRKLNDKGRNFSSYRKKTYKIKNTDSSRNITNEEKKVPNNLYLFFSPRGRGEKRYKFLDENLNDSKNRSSRIKRVKPNCYYNKIHLNKINKINFS